MASLGVGISLSESLVRCSPPSEPTDVPAWGHWTFGGGDADRWRWQQRLYNAHYGYHPDIGYVKQSLVDRAREVEPRPDRLRVLVLGDSIAEQGTFVSRFDTLLLREYPQYDIEVINAGTRGYDPTLERRFLEHVGLAMAPDLIVVQLCLNDFLPTPIIFAGGDGGWMAYDGGGSLAGWISPFLFRHSALYRRLALRMIQLGSRESTEQQDHRVRFELDAIRHLARTRGIPLTFVVFPFFVPSHRQPPMLERMRRVLEDLDLGSVTLDLEAAFQTNPARLLAASPGDPVHTSPLADAIAARELLEFSRPILSGLLRAKPRSGARSIFPANFISEDTPRGFETSGLWPLEREKEAAWRWLVGPEMQIRFESNSPADLALTFAWRSPIARQRVELLLNGEEVRTWEALDGGALVRGREALDVRPGENVVSLTVDRWGGPNHPFAFPDERPLALQIQILSLSKAHAGARRAAPRPSKRRAAAPALESYPRPTAGSSN